MTPRELGARRARPVTQLCEEYGIAGPLAEWAVATWDTATNAVSGVPVRVTA